MTYVRIAYVPGIPGNCRTWELMLLLKMLVGVVARIYFVLGLIYCVRMCLVWLTWQLLLMKQMLGGWWCFTHLFRVGTNLLHTYVPSMAYLGVVLPGSFFTLLRTW